MGTNLNEPMVSEQNDAHIAAPDVRLNENKKKGIVIISDNNLITRLWFLLTNPFRYIFTKKIRY